MTTGVRASVVTVLTTDPCQFVDLSRMGFQCGNHYQWCWRQLRDAEEKKGSCVLTFAHRDRDSFVRHPKFLSCMV